MAENDASNSVTAAEFGIPIGTIKSWKSRKRNGHKPPKRRNGKKANGHKKTAKNPVTFAAIQASSATPATPATPNAPAPPPAPPSGDGNEGPYAILTGSNHSRFRDPQVRKTILDALAAGAPRTLAASAALISPALIGYWTTRGRKAREAQDQYDLEGNGQTIDELDQAFVYFLQQVEQAEAVPKMTALAAWTTEMQNQMVPAIGPDGEPITDPETGEPLMTVSKKGNWKAAMAFLEKRERQSFGNQVEIQHTGPGGGPVQVEHHVLHEMNPEQLAALATGQMLPEPEMVIEGEIIEEEKDSSPEE